MLRHNVFACARDTREGVLKPRFSTAARSGPYPPLDPAEPQDDGPPRRPSFNAIGTVNTPVVVLADRLKVAGSRASAWGGIPTPARKSPSHDGDRIEAASYNGMNAVEGAASGPLVIQQGVDSSGRDTELVAAPSGVFTSADRNAASSLNGMSAVEGGSSGRGVIQQGVYSSGHDKDPPAVAPAEVFASADRNAVSSLNSMSTVEGGSSGRGVIQQGVDSSGRDTDPPAVAPAEVFASAARNAVSSLNGMSAVEGGSSGRGVIQQGVDSSGRDADPSAAPAEVTASADDNAASSFNGVNPMEGGSSGRKVIQHGVDSSGRGADFRGAPLAAHSASFSSEDGDFDAARITSTKTSSAFGSPGSGVGSVQAGASGRGLMSGSGLERTDPSGTSSAPSHRNYFSLPNLPPTKKGFQSSRNMLFLSSSDLVASESGSAAGKGSGKKIIGRGESNEHELEHEYDRPAPTEGSGDGTERMSGAVPRAGRGAGGSKFALSVLKSRPPVESEVPRRRGIPALAAAAAATSTASSSPPIPGSERNSGNVGTDEKGDDDESCGRHTRGVQDPYDTDSAAESEPSGTNSDAHQGHPRGRDEGGQGFGAPFSLLPAGFRKNPTESALPRRRSMPAPAWDLPANGFRGSLDTSVPNEEGEDASTPDGSRSGADLDAAIGEEESDGPGLEASASHGRRSTGGGRGWGLKSRQPVAVDLPRRSSGYSADASGRSMHGLDAAGGQPLSPPQETADGGAEGMPSDQEGGIAQSSDEERVSRTSSGAGGTSVFAGLMGRRPVESGLPRRRRSSEISLPEGQVVVPVEDSSDRGDHGTSGASGEENERSSGSVVPASRGSSSSSSVSARGGWGLRSKPPVAVDIPRRNSGYSADVSGRSVSALDVAAGQPLPGQCTHADDGSADAFTSDAEGGVGSTRQDSRGNASLGGGRKSLFPALVGHKCAPVESDLPRRRPSGYSTAESEGTAKSGGEDTEAESVYPDSQNVDSSRSGKGGTRWGLMGRRAPIASEVPRRGSVRSSRPSHAATVVACQDALGSSESDLSAGHEHSVLAGGVTSVRSGHGLGMSVGSSIGDIGALGTSMGSSAMGESDRYSTYDRSWSGQTHAARSLGAVGEDSGVLAGGVTSVRSGHGLGPSMGSSIGAGEACGDGDSSGSCDDEGETKIPLR